MFYSLTLLEYYIFFFLFFNDTITLEFKKNEKLRNENENDSHLHFVNKVHIFLTIYR